MAEFEYKPTACKKTYRMIVLRKKIRVEKGQQWLKVLDHMADLDRAADIALRNPYYDPRPIEKTAIRALLDNAFHGLAPGH